MLYYIGGIKLQRIIDFHAHIYPSKIADKAAKSIGDFYDIPMQENGSAEHLLEHGRKVGVCHYIVHSVATRPDQVENINNFIADSVKAHPKEFIGFGTLHPDMDNIEKEVDRIISLGLKGIKLHPDFQKFNIDSPKAMKIYEVIEGRLPVLVHTGDYRYEYSQPKRMRNVIDTFPKLTVIGAHLGGWSQWEEAMKCLLDRNLYVDSSSSLYAFSPEKGKEIIRTWGADRVLFGTDYPMWVHEEELERFYALGLSEEENRKILYENAAKLLQLDEAVK